MSIVRVPDTLSRALIDELQPVVSQPIDLTDAEFQSDDYSKLRVEVETHQTELPDIRVKEGVIYKRMLTTVDSDDGNTWKVWIPDGMQLKIIQEAHNPPSSAHGGVDKTVNLVKRYYYWPGMSKDVREFVSKCSICKETKAPNQHLGR